MLARSGLVVASAHVVAGSDGLVPVADLDALQSLGVETAVLTYLPPEMFSDHDALDRATATIERIAGQLRARGMTLGYHNHTWELATKVDGEPALLRLFDRLAPRCSPRSTCTGRRWPASTRLRSSPGSALGSSSST